MAFQGCPGSKSMNLSAPADSAETVQTGSVQSQLSHWPIQLHLINPTAPYYQGSNVLLAADCTAFAVGSFHNDFLKNKAVAIACPKLDDGQDEYVQKIQAWAEDAKINTLTIVMMQVPCCGGLLHVAKKALKQSNRKIPIKSIIVSLQGEILSEEWIPIE